MKTPPAFLSSPSKRFAPQRLGRIVDIFLAVPLIVALIVTGLYLTLWRADPLVHFTHAIWVLGFWMIGTLGTFTFIILARLKFRITYLISVPVFAALFTAVYFTPLSRYTALFSNPAGMILPAVIGGLNTTISWLIVLRFRIKINKTISSKGENNGIA